MTLVVRGGTVVTAAGAFPADVLVEGEKVAALADPATGLARGWAASADRVVDAAGKYVVPGGVDAHTHMQLQLGGTVSSDDFETGTRAAAWGGTTTIVDFAAQAKGESVREGLEARLAEAEGRCAIDYGLHMVLGDVGEASLKEMDALVDEGVTSFKLFMAYPGTYYSTDGEILEAMQRAAANGALVMMHAENGIAIDVLVAQARARGHTDPAFHARTRPSALEGEATARAIALAKVTGAPLYVVHLSAAEALAAVVAARDAGQNVFAETCPQYLYLSADELDRPGFEGAKYVCSPPLRPREHQDELWRGLRTNDVSVVATDHCPFCWKDQKELGRGDFSKIPNGLPGVEHRMDLTYQGVVDGRLSLERWVEVTSTTPARMFGLYPKKGAVAPGSDADLVVYDPAATQVLSAATSHMAVDYSCYEGTPVRGKVDAVVSRGRVILEGGRYLGRPGDGAYLARSACQYLA